MPVRLLWFLKPSVSGGLCGQNTKQSSSRRWRCKCISESRLAPTPGDLAGSAFPSPSFLVLSLLAVTKGAARVLGDRLGQGGCVTWGRE